jgi:hypothetical protein
LTSCFSSSASTTGATKKNIWEQRNARQKTTIRKKRAARYFNKNHQSVR